MRPSARGLVASATALLFTFAIAGSAVAEPGNSNSAGADGMTILRPRNAGPHPASANQLLYQGGPVQSGATPRVYISYWGSQWSSGFTTGGYSSGKAQTYVGGFFSNVGGSTWNNIDTQYCSGVAVGTINCGSSGTHIQNPAGQLGGTWNDTSPIPRRIRQSDIASAALRLVNYFGYSASATYMVFTPTGRSMSGFGTQWCAWHSMTTSGGNNVAYAYIPYIPDAGSACGMNFVNSSNNSYGNGYFDGFSVVAGHEFAEAQTDPFTSSATYAWLDQSGAENADKCAWSSLSTNISLGGQNYAVQPIWSNTNSGCRTS